MASGITTLGPSLRGLEVIQASIGDETSGITTLSNGLEWQAVSPRLTFLKGNWM